MVTDRQKNFRIVQEAVFNASAASDSRQVFHAAATKSHTIGASPWRAYCLFLAPAALIAWEWRHAAANFSWSPCRQRQPHAHNIGTSQLRFNSPPQIRCGPIALVLPAMRHEPIAGIFVGTCTPAGKRKSVLHAEKICRTIKASGWIRRARANRRAIHLADDIGPRRYLRETEASNRQLGDWDCLARKRFDGSFERMLGCPEAIGFLHTREKCVFFGRLKI